MRRRAFLAACVGLLGLPTLVGANPSANTTVWEARLWAYASHPGWVHIKTLRLPSLTPLIRFPTVASPGGKVEFVDFAMGSLPTGKDRHVINYYSQDPAAWFFRGLWR